MAADWLEVDNRVFMQLNEQYDNRFAVVELLGIETDFDMAVRTYTFDCTGHDLSMMYLYVHYSLETNQISEVYESLDSSGESAGSID